MARSLNPLIVLDANGKPLAGAKVETLKRPSGETPSAYAAETGAGPAANPATTNAQGRVIQWLDRGAYNSRIVATGMETYEVAWDAAPAGNTAIDAPWLAVSLQNAVSIPRIYQPAALPSSPSDGEQVDYVGEAGQVWRFRYRAASGSVHKWDFVGGSDLIAYGGGSAENTLAGSEYKPLQEAAGTPTITVPLAGDYIMWGSVAQVSQRQKGYEPNVAAIVLQYMSGATAFDGLYLGSPGMTKQYAGQAVHGRGYVGNLEAGKKYKLWIAGNNTEAKLWAVETITLGLLPIRVG